MAPLFHLYKKSVKCILTIISIFSCRKSSGSARERSILIYAVFFFFQSLNLKKMKLLQNKANENFMYFLSTEFFQHSISRQETLRRRIFFSILIIQPLSAIYEKDGTKEKHFRLTKYLLDWYLLLEENEVIVSFSISEIAK